MYHIIFNPYANRGGAKQYLDAFTALLTQEGAHYAVYETKRPGHASCITRELIGGGARCIIIVGGDGTIHEVMNGYNEGDDVVFGIIPAGTGNDVANMLGIPSALEDVKAAAQCILAKQEGTVDLISSRQGEQSMLFFSYGIAAAMILQMQKYKKKNKLSYYRALLKLVFTFKPGIYEVVYDGKHRRFKADFCALHNCICAGGGMTLINDAIIDDGYAELFMVENKNLGRRILNFISILRKKVAQQPNVQIVKVQNAVINSLHGTLCCIDGENHEFERLELNLRPGAVRVFRNIGRL